MDVLGVLADRQMVEGIMRPTLKKLPCKGGCGEDVLANPDVVFGPYHRECWTKFLTNWVNLQNALEKEKR